MMDRAREYLKEFSFGEVFRFDFAHLKGDLAGGFTSAVVALPLALGFGILAYGGDPRGAVAGLYGAIFTGFLASLFGGTPRQITGPTGGMTVILTMVYKDLGGPDALLAACLIAGLLQIAYGLLKVGRFISFVPYPVIVGFTNGIAVLIFMQQLPILAEAPLLAAITLAVIIAVPYVHRGIPRALVGLLAGTLVASFAFHHVGALRWAIDADTLSFVASDTLRTIGEIPRSFSFPGLPALEWSTWSRLIPAGLTISLLGTLETLLASVVADSMTGDRHNSERELIGQGIGNFVAGLFGGIAGTGAIVRTNVNIRAGGTTKLAGMIHALVLVAIMMVLSPWVSVVPLVVLGSVLTMTAIGMFEWEPLRLLPKSPLPDALVLLLTMVITIIADLITAVLAGFALAGFLFVYRMSELGVTNLLTANRTGLLSPRDLERLRRHRIMAYDIEGPLFFGAARNFVREIERESSYRVIILNMQSVPVIDTTGALALEDIVDRIRRDRKKLIIAGLRKEVRTVLHRLGVSQKIGVGNFAGDLRRAIDYAEAYATGQAERMHLGTYLSQDLMLLDVETESKEELFALMAAKAAHEDFVTDIDAFLKDLWEREESASTGLANGVALPHSRSGSTGRVIVIAARLSKPIPYETLDGKPVRLVFMIAASQENDVYLHLLSLLAKAVGKAGVIDALMNAGTAHDMYDILAHEIDHEDHP